MQKSSLISKAAITLSILSIVISICCVWYPYRQSHPSNDYTQYGPYTDYKPNISKLTVCFVDGKSEKCLDCVTAQTATVPADYVFFATPYAVKDENLGGKLLAMNELPSIKGEFMIGYTAELTTVSHKKKTQTHGIAIEWEEFRKLFPNLKENTPVYGAWYPYNKGQVLSKDAPYKLKKNKRFYMGISREQG